MSLAILAAAALAVGSASAGSMSAAQPKPVPVHRCHLHARIPDDGAGQLSAFKSFRDDGSIDSMQVTLEDNGANAVRRATPGDQAFVMLRWPGGHRARPEGSPLDWDDGSIRITYISAKGEQHRKLRGEEWRQVVVDRNNAALAYDSEGRRELFLPGTNVHLVSDLESLSSPGSLNSSLDSLMAWGTGAGRITVYEVIVTRRPRPRNSYPTSPAGRRRIVAAYDLDVAALARTAGLVRAAVTRWESVIAETWRTCERTTEGGEVVIGKPKPAPRL